MTALDGIRLVARRELTERTRERSFLISTVVTLLILCGFIVIPKVFFSDRTPTWDVGLVGAGSAPLARPLETQAPLVGARVRVQRPADAAAAEAALRDGDLDLAIVDGRQLLNNPDGTIATVASYLPPTAPLVMPVRVAAGAASGWEIVVSVLLTVAAIAVLVPLSARLYSGAVLRTGARVKLSSAWSASRG